MLDLIEEGVENFMHCLHCVAINDYSLAFSRHSCDFNLSASQEQYIRINCIFPQNPEHSSHIPCL